MFLLPIFVMFSSVSQAAPPSLSAVVDILSSGNRPRATVYMSSETTGFKALTIESNAGSLKLLEVTRGSSVMKVNGVVLPDSLSLIVFRRKLEQIRMLKQNLFDQARALLGRPVRLAKEASTDRLSGSSFSELKKQLSQATLVGIRREGVSWSLILESQKKTNWNVALQTSGNELTRVELFDNQDGVDSTVWQAASDSKRASEIIQILSIVFKGSCERTLSR